MRSYFEVVRPKTVTYPSITVCPFPESENYVSSFSPAAETLLRLDTTRLDEVLTWLIYHRLVDGKRRPQYVSVAAPADNRTDVRGFHLLLPLGVGIGEAVRCFTFDAPAPTLPGAEYLVRLSENPNRV